MAIECYYKMCPFHETQFDPASGPYCYQEECMINEFGLNKFATQTRIVDETPLIEADAIGKPDGPYGGE